MRCISNAFFHQAEVTQVDRWEHGPMELAFLPNPEASNLEMVAHVHEWNQTQRAGFVRSGRAIDGLKPFVPYLEERRNPNMILVPTYDGTSELDIMLAGLLPDRDLAQAGLERRRASMGLLFPHHDLPIGYGQRAREAFGHYIWTRLCPLARLKEGAFSARSPLRLLAGDTRYWAHRLYRLAMERRDQWFESTTHEDATWEPLEDLREKLLSQLPEEERHLFEVRRPLMGSDVWDEFDADEREDAIQCAIAGDGVLPSLEPVVELLHSHRAHEDFSATTSWIKEDFERSFYSKRAKLKVDLIETVDDAPAYQLEPNEPYEQVLFRDVVAVLNQKERRLVLALRLGKNASTIARDAGLRGHASVSRNIAALKAKIEKLVN